MIRGNIGEWSEFYAFIKILVERKISAADSKLNPIPDKQIEVLKVSREERRNKVISYDITDEERISIIEDGVALSIVDAEVLKKGIASIFSQMKNNTERTFEIPSVDSVFRQLNCTSLKAGSSKKADILLLIHDRISSVDIEQGFSIKSMIGEPATLLNAGKGTNFIFKVVGKNSSKMGGKVNKIQSRAAIRDRVEAIHDLTGKLVFFNIASETFSGNLRKIDIFLPEILAELVVGFYGNKGRTIKELVENTDFSNIVGPSGYVLTQEVCAYKIKQFLAAIALGLTPEKSWDGLSQAKGGYIVVREDGDLVCYHLYNRDEFQEYLYENTKLETASTSRHEFGTVYKEGDESMIKLNLQIRFLR